MKRVMVSGHFDPFHYAHLEYIKKASRLGDKLVCVVSSDKQVMMKKGKVNEPDYERQEVMALVLAGLGLEYSIFVNRWDTDTTYIVEALRALKPNIFCRGTDKTITDMPPEEKRVCDDLGIEIVHIKGRTAHGSEFI